jgi:oligopeptide transport system substrate-binding protein
VPLLLLFYTTSCEKEKENLSSKVLKKESPMLKICFATEIQSLDPRLSVDHPSEHAIQMLFEGLMSHSAQGELITAIAERYDISEDQKTYTFHLRNALWSNGDPVTAYDFEYAWKKVIDPSFKGSGLQNFYPIKNVQAFIQGKKPLEEVGIRCLDERTLVVELEHPTPYFLEVTAMSCFSPVHQNTDQQNPKWATQVGADFVCNGPFTIQTHRYEDELVFLKNPKYWDATHVMLAGIKVAIIKDPQTQLGMFEKKDLEWIGKPLSKLSLDALPHLKKQGIVSQIPSLGIYWYFLNTTAFPFNNKNMRKAFALAINRKEITEHVLQEDETPALNILPQKIAVHSAPYFQDYALAEARNYFNTALKEMGIAKEDLLPITLSYTSSEFNLRVAQVIQQQWYDAFGIRVQLESSEWKVHYQNLVNGTYQIGAMTWNSWLTDPIYMLQTFRDHTDGINMSQWVNTDYQQLLADSEEELDPKKRKEIFYLAEKILMNEMPVIPLFFTTISFAKNKALQNVYVSELYKINFKWAYIEENKDEKNSP